MNDSVSIGLKSVRSGNQNRRQLFEEGQMFSKFNQPSECPQDSVCDEINRIEIVPKEQEQDDDEEEQQQQQYREQIQAMVQSSQPEPLNLFLTNNNINDNQNILLQNNQQQLQQSIVLSQSQTVKNNDNHNHAKQMHSLRQHGQFLENNNNAKQINFNNQNSSFPPENQDGQQQKLQNVSLNITWRKYGFNILKFIQKFLIQIKRQTNQIRFREMQKHQFHLVNDLSCDWTYYLRRKMLNKQLQPFFTRAISSLRASIKPLICWEKIKNTNAMQFVLNFQLNTINPEELPKVLWDIFIFAMLLFIMIFLPIKFAFQDMKSQYQVHFGSSVDSAVQATAWLLLLDQLLLLNTEAYSKGEIIVNRKKILKLRLKQGYLKHLTVIILFLISALQVSDSLQFMEAVIFLLCFQVVSRLNTLIERLNLRQASQALADLYKLILLILFIGHLCACGFSLMHSLETQADPDGRTWLDMAELDPAQAHWTQVYVAGLYWATITMITVGYGDIHPVNMYEQIAIVIFTFLSCGLFAYSVNQVGLIIHQITKRAKRLRTRLFTLSSYMQKKGLPGNLQIKVKKYFEYLSEENQEENKLCEEMMAQLPVSLRQEVIQEFNCRVLRSHKLFNFHFSMPFLKELSLLLKEKQCFAEELLFPQDSINDCLYFLVKGEVKLFKKARSVIDQSTNNQQTIKTLSSNSISQFLQSNINYSYNISNFNYNNNNYLNNINSAQIINNNNNSNNYNFNNAIQLFDGKQRGEQLIGTLKKGDLFNERSFFSQQRTNYSAVSKNLATVLCLRRDDCLALLKKYNKDFQIFQEFKDKINSYEDYKGLETRCFSCMKFTHQLDTCSYVQFCPAIEKVVQRIKEESLIKQERKSFNRKKREHFRVLTLNQDVQQTILSYVFDRGDDQMVEDMIDRLKIILDQINIFNENLNNNNNNNNNNNQIRGTLISNCSNKQLYQKSNSQDSRKSRISVTLQSQYEQTQQSNQQVQQLLQQQQQQSIQQQQQRSSSILLLSQQQQKEDNAAAHSQTQQEISSSSSSNSNTSRTEKTQQINDQQQLNSVIIAQQLQQQQTIEESKSFQNQNSIKELKNPIQYQNTIDDSKLIGGEINSPDSQNLVASNSINSNNNLSKSANSLGQQHTHSIHSSYPHTNSNKSNNNNNINSINRENRQSLIFSSLKDFERKRKQSRKKRIIFNEIVQSNEKYQHCDSKRSSIASILSQKSQNKNGKTVRSNSNRDDLSSSVSKLGGDDDDNINFDQMKNWEFYFVYNNFEYIFNNQFKQYLNTNKLENITFKNLQKKINEDRLRQLIRNIPGKSKSFKRITIQSPIYLQNSKNISIFSEKQFSLHPIQIEQEQIQPNL